MWRAKRIDLSAGTITVFPINVDVHGVYVNDTLSPQDCEIKDGADSVFSVPASTAEGTRITFAGEEGVVFDNSLIVAPDPAATGSITVMYRQRK